MDKDRVSLYKSVTKYDPVQSRNITTVEIHATYPCLATNISSKRQLETFGNLTSADITVRLLNKRVENITHLVINSKKHKVARISVYQNDTVIYAKEVQSW
ncbi:hypothetical protein [Macrococcoides caseolyticum]|uniref:hypothetical protein n=1 Tax=Macrococcoides caseolyticum TaxID=69966 RepID=UPI0011A05A9D|nr:hypothetical protein [Macrococcus caseolyticus]